MANLNFNTRQPFYFGPPARPLFAWRHRASAPSRNGMGVVVCPPLGHEFVHSFRSLRRFADQLAAAGVEVLRLEYDGTGNSAGIDEEPERVNAWLASIEYAIQQLRTDASITKIGLIGVRIGADLAAHVAAQHALDFLVVWAPQARGRDFVRELKAVQRTGEINSSDPQIVDGAIEAAGFIYTAATQQALMSLDIANMVPRATRILWVSRDDIVDDESGLKAWRDAGLNVAQMRLAGVAEMLLPAHASVVPESAIASIVDWVAADRKKIVHASDDLWGSVNFTISGDFLRVDNATRFHYSVQEELWRFGTQTNLFGILSTPLATHSEADKPVVVLLNAGAVHNIGPHRLYVMLARTLAEHGFCCLRMDISGKGDSDAAPGHAENIVYTPRAVADITEALAELTTRLGARRFVMLGLCSGAHDAFHAAVELPAPIVEAIMLNPLSFYWQVGMSLTDAPTRQYSHWAHYMRSLRQWSRWKKLLFGKVQFGKIAALIVQRIGLRVRFKVPAATPKNPGVQKRREDLAADLRTIAAQGRQMSFFIADTDPGYDILMSNAGRTVKKLQRSGSLTIARVAQSNHTFTSRTARRTLIEQVAKHLKDRYD
ncbi:MAG: alpha/beta fold hydrolase [Pseudomonadota bacterium]